MAFLAEESNLQALRRWLRLGEECTSEQGGPSLQLPHCLSSRAPQVGFGANMSAVVLWWQRWAREGERGGGPGVPMCACTEYLCTFQARLPLPRRQTS